MVDVHVDLVGLYRSLAISVQNVRQLAHCGIQTEVSRRLLYAELQEALYRTPSPFGFVLRLRINRAIPEDLVLPEVRDRIVRKVEENLGAILANDWDWGGFCVEDESAVIEVELDDVVKGQPGNRRITSPFLKRG